MSVNGINYDTWVASLDTATLADADLFTVVQSAVSKKVAASALAAYVIDELYGASAVSPALTGDNIVLFRGTDEKTVTIDLLASYVVATGWSVASEADPAISGDMVLANRSGTIYELDVDTIGAYAVTILAASAAVTSMTAGDDFVLYRSGVAKLMDISYIASYVLGLAWDSAAITPALGTDEVFVGRAGVSKTATVDVLKTYILDGIQATVLNIDSLGAATLASGDKFHVDQSGTAKSATLTALETKLWADFATYVAALSDAATVVDSDKFYTLNGSTAKYCTATELAVYVTAELWASSDAASVVTGDTFLLKNGSTTYECTVDLLQTFINTGLQATILDISGLSAATIAGTDTVLICQTSTAKKATVATLEAHVHDAFSVYLAALDAAATPADADLFYVTQSGTEKKLTLSSLTAHVVEQARTLPWTEVDAAKYTATPASTSTITMSDTSDFAVGVPVKYAYGGTTYYGVVTAVSSNTLLTIAGAALDTGVALTALSVGIPEMMHVEEIVVTSQFGDTAQDILAEVEERYLKWQRADAYLVAFSGTLHWIDSGAAQPKINVKIEGSLVGTQDSNKGITLSAVAGTWVDSSAVAISAANYSIVRGEDIEIRCTEAGTTGDAESLSVSLVFVYE